MKSIDPTIKKETLFISVVTLILSALLESVYLITGKWDITVILGNLLGSGVGILNFFFMCIGLSNALGKDAKAARTTVTFSHTMRFILMAVVVGLSVFIEWFALLPTLISLFFPTVGVYIRAMKVKGKDNSNVSSETEQT